MTPATWVTGATVSGSCRTQRRGLQGHSATSPPLYTAQGSEIESTLSCASGCGSWAQKACGVQGHLLPAAAVLLELGVGSGVPSAPLGPPPPASPRVYHLFLVLLRFCSL